MQKSKAVLLISETATVAENKAQSTQTRGPAFPETARNGVPEDELALRQETAETEVRWEEETRVPVAAW